jgi:hypothetical protein
MPKRTSLSGLQTRNTNLEHASNGIHTQQLAQQAYRLELNDYELERSLSMSEDAVDADMARFYPTVGKHTSECLCGHCTDSEDYYIDTDGHYQRYS